jgi:hypothetical protein
MDAGPSGAEEGQARRIKDTGGLSYPSAHLHLMCGVMLLSCFKTDRIEFASWEGIPVVCSNWEAWQRLKPRRLRSRHVC